MVKGPEQMFYHGLSAEQAAYWSSKLAPHSYATVFVGVPSAAWRTIPSSYLICEDDRAIPVFVQEAMVEHRWKSRGYSALTAHSCHSPMPLWVF